MQRKTTKNNRQANKAEKYFQAWCKNQPCVVTGDYGVHVHHCKGSTFKHNKVLIGHWFVIPLTPDKHAEYHAGTKAFRTKYGNQSELWHELMMDYYHETGIAPPEEVTEAILNYGH